MFRCSVLLKQGLHMHGNKSLSIPYTYIFTPLLIFAILKLDRWKL